MVLTLLHDAAAVVGVTDRLDSLHFDWLPHLRSPTQVPKTVTAYRLDATHANPMGAWNRMGSPAYPTKAQLEALHAASAVHAESIGVTRVTPTESQLTLSLAEYAALHIVFGPEEQS